MLRKVILLGMLLSIGVSYSAEMGELNCTITDGRLVGSGTTRLRFLGSDVKLLTRCEVDLDGAALLGFAIASILNSAPSTIREADEVYVGCEGSERGPVLEGRASSISWKVDPAGGAFEKVYHIDYEGSRRGPLKFSVASTSLLNFAYSLMAVNALADHGPVKGAEVCMEPALNGNVTARITVHGGVGQKIRYVRFGAEEISAEEAVAQQRANSVLSSDSEIGIAEGEMSPPYEDVCRTLS